MTEDLFSYAGRVADATPADISTTTTDQPETIEIDAEPSQAPAPSLPVAYSKRRPTHVRRVVSDERPMCHGRPMYAHKKETTSYKDAPFEGDTPQVVEVTRHRWRCKICGKTERSPLPIVIEPYPAMTRALADYLARNIFELPLSYISRVTGVASDQISRIAAWYADVADRRIRPYAPTRLGIDEVHTAGGARFVMADIGRQPARLIDIRPVRDEDTVAEALLALPDIGRIEWIAMDMYVPYAKAVAKVARARPDEFRAQIVVDKRHAQMLATKALRGILAKLFKIRLESDLPQGDVPTELDLWRDELWQMPAQKRLEKLGARYHFHVRRDLKDREKQEAAEAKRANWAAFAPLSATAYDLKEAFYDIYNHGTYEGATRAFEDWCEALKAHPLLEEAFAPVAETVRKWHTEIFNYFLVPGRPVTNAATECLNGWINGIVNSGRGYSFDTLRPRVLALRGIWADGALEAALEAERELPDYAQRKKDFLDKEGERRAARREQKKKDRRAKEAP